MGMPRWKLSVLSAPRSRVSDPGGCCPAEALALRGTAGLELAGTGPASPLLLPCSWRAASRRSVASGTAKKRQEPTAARSVSFFSFLFNFSETE